MTVLAARALESRSAQTAVALVDQIERLFCEIFSSILGLVLELTNVCSMPKVIRGLSIPTDFARSVPVEHVSETQKLRQTDRLGVEWCNCTPVGRVEQLKIL